MIDSKMMISTSYVPAWQLEHVWDEAKPLLELAQRRIAGKMTIDDIHTNLKLSEQQLWMVRVDGKAMAAITTTLEVHPQCKLMRIMLIGGQKMPLWLDQSLCVIKEAARALGCKTIEADGRLGWAKHAPKCGFKEVTRTYELEI